MLPVGFVSGVLAGSPKRRGRFCRINVGGMYIEALRFVTILECNGLIVPSSSYRDAL